MYSNNKQNKYFITQSLAYIWWKCKIVPWDKCPTEKSELASRDHLEHQEVLKAMTTWSSEHDYGLQQRDHAAHGELIGIYQRTQLSMKKTNITEPCENVVGIFCLTWQSLINEA